MGRCKSWSVIKQCTKGFQKVGSVLNDLSSCFKEMPSFGNVGYSERVYHNKSNEKIWFVCFNCVENKGGMNQDNKLTNKA